MRTETKIEPRSPEFTDLMSRVRAGELASVFVYGTLMSGLHNNHIMPVDARWCEAKTALPVFLMRSHGGFPAVEMVSMRPGLQFPESGFGYVAGEVWFVDAGTVARMDGLEGYPGWYDKKNIPIILMGASGNFGSFADIYTLNTGNEKVGENSQRGQCWRKYITDRGWG